MPNVLRQSFNEHLETKSFHCQPDAVVEETGTDQPLFGEGFARNGTVIIDGFGSPECHRHECGIWVMELAEGLATEPDESLVPWVNGVPAYGVMQHWVTYTGFFATDGLGSYF